MSELKNAFARSASTLAQDFLGAVALVVAFVVVLNLPLS